jgi:hypothetical protein
MTVVESDDVEQRDLANGDRLRRVALMFRIVFTIHE